MDKKEIEFAKGVKVKQSFPDLFSISIKFDEFSEWAFAHKNENGYLNLNIARTKSKDTWYCRLNEWQPTDKKTVTFKDFKEEEKLPF